MDSRNSGAIQGDSDLRQMARAGSSVLGTNAAGLDSAGRAGAAEFLTLLGYADSAESELPHRTALLTAAGTFRRLFFLPVPDAPGAVAMGGELYPPNRVVDTNATISVAGLGTTPREAFEACIGEGIERLSIMASPRDDYITLPAAVALAGAPDRLRTEWNDLAPFRRQTSATMSSWLVVRGLRDDAQALVPADLCRSRALSDRDIDVPWPLSNGCAAAPSASVATVLALLELIERDAAALWWCGGNPARPLSADSLATQEAATLLGGLRGTALDRVTWLLDISSDIAVPVIAALSCTHAGTGLCCGLAARPTQRAAARRAILEMCQMELGSRIAAVKLRERGTAGLMPDDAAHLRRTELPVAACPPLQANPPPAAAHDITAMPQPALLKLLCDRLAAQGLEAYSHDLTDPELGVAVMRVICPGLQPAPAPPVTDRLARVAARFGRASTLFELPPLM